MHLHSDFPNVTVLVDFYPRPGSTFERRNVFGKLPEQVRKARAAAWYRRHFTPDPVRCGDAWPPMPLRLIGHEVHQ